MNTLACCLICYIWHLSLSKIDDIPLLSSTRVHQYSTVQSSTEVYCDHETFTPLTPDTPALHCPDIDPGSRGGGRIPTIHVYIEEVGKFSTKTCYHYKLIP